MHENVSGLKFCAQYRAFIFLGHRILRVLSLNYYNNFRDKLY